MTERGRFRVYLAGPISGCNETQMRRWRDTVKREYDKRMAFLDPVENLVDSKASPYEVVEADLHAIEEADGLLVNMWRESIGTAIGVAHAHSRGRLIVVADPNHLQSRILGFFADAVEESPRQGAKTLWNLLRAESWRVVKSGGEGEEEQFERRKITEAVRAVCRHTGRDHVIVPGLVLPQVIAHLRGSDRKLEKLITTTDISNAVADVLHELERDSVHAEAVEGMANAWRSRAERKGPQSPTRTAAPTDRVRTAAGAGRVPISCGSKSHGTIWDSTVKCLDDIPSRAARRIFGKIASVPGITEITLGPFARKGSRNTCQAWVGKSPTPYVVEGKLYDSGLKGTMQTFQVWVQFDSSKPRIVEAIQKKLRDDGAWASR